MRFLVPASRRIAVCTGRRCVSREASPIHVATTDSESRGGLRVGVVGLGAIGTIFFTQLASVALRHPHLVRSVDGFVKPHHLTQLKQQRRLTLSEPHAADAPFATLKLEEKNGLVVAADGAVRIQTLGDTGTDHGPLDVVLIALKAFDSAHVVEELQTQHAHRFRRDAVFVLLQNGLGALPDKATTTGSGIVASYVNGVTYVGGRVRTLGEVVVSGFSTEATYFAPVALPADGAPSEVLADRLGQLGAALSDAGLKWQLLSHREMQTMLWRKLIVNAAINPIAAVLNAPNGHVGACEWSKRSVETVVREAMAVADKEGVDLQCSEQEMVETVLRVAANTSANVCSTVADLRKGARTEIDAITGQVLHCGHRHGVPTPANALLFELVKALEEQQLRKEGAPA